MKINTFNKFAVGVKGSRVVIVNQRAASMQLTREDAFLLAAYLVAMANILPASADFEGVEFGDFLEAVENS